MVTVYDLAYILVNFQAVINNMTDIIYHNIQENYQFTEEKIVSESIYDKMITEGRAFRNEIAGQNHPRWQNEIEDNFEKFLLDVPKTPLNYHSRTKPTTSRRFNKKYRMNLRLNGFFQHERLIHLIVTVTFAVLTLMSFVASLIVGMPALLVLTVLFMVLLIPYIMHYYTLENEVQKMYIQYDRIMEYIRNSKEN